MLQSQEKGRFKSLLLPILAVLVVVLVFSNALTYANLRNLENQVNNLRLQLDELDEAHENYVSTHSYSNTEYETLKSESETLKSERDALVLPKISLLSLTSQDVRIFAYPGNYLRVYGDVWNVGGDTAYNVVLHVVAYQGAVRATDTYIYMGAIPGENRKTIDERVYYAGAALTSWNITADWRSSE